MATTTSEIPTVLLNASEKSTPIAHQASHFQLPELAAQILVAHKHAEVDARSALEHARAAGELLLEAKSRVAHGGWLPWLEQNCPGLSPRSAQNYMRIAARWDELRTKTKRDSDLPLRQGIALLRESASVEWYSPARIIEAARTVLGDIDLDPASSPTANRTVRANKFFTLEDSGLSHDWPGRVWLNPPYGGEVRKFVQHLLDQMEKGITTAAVLLTSAVPTGDLWFQDLLRQRPVCFVGRVRYTNSKGIEKPSLHASAAVYFGPDPERFRDAFDELGPVVRPMGHAAVDNGPWSPAPTTSGRRSARAKQSDSSPTGAL